MNNTISIDPYKKYKTQAFGGFFKHHKDINNDIAIHFFNNVIIELNKLTFFGNYFGNNGYHFGHELINIIQKQSIICTFCGNYPKMDLLGIYCVKCNICIN